MSDQPMTMIVEPLPSDRDEAITFLQNRIDTATAAYTGGQTIADYVTLALAAAEPEPYPEELLSTRETLETLGLNPDVIAPLPERPPVPTAEELVAGVSALPYAYRSWLEADGQHGPEVVEEIMAALRFTPDGAEEFLASLPE
jgi:hypothetical protein